MRRGLIFVIIGLLIIPGVYALDASVARDGDLVSQCWTMFKGDFLDEKKCFDPPLTTEGINLECDQKCKGFEFLRTRWAGSIFFRDYENRFIPGTNNLIPIPPANEWDDLDLIMNNIMDHREITEEKPVVTGDDGGLYYNPRNKAFEWNTCYGSANLTMKCIGNDETTYEEIDKIIEYSNYKSIDYPGDCFNFDAPKILFGGLKDKYVIKTLTGNNQRGRAHLEYIDQGTYIELNDDYYCMDLTFNYNYDESVETKTLIKGFADFLGGFAENRGLDGKIFKNVNLDFEVEVIDPLIGDDKLYLIKGGIELEF